MESFGGPTVNFPLFRDLQIRKRIMACLKMATSPLILWPNQMMIDHTHQLCLLNELTSIS